MFVRDRWGNVGRVLEAKEHSDRGTRGVTIVEMTTDANTKTFFVEADNLAIDVNCGHAQLKKMLEITAKRCRGTLTIIPPNEMDEPTPWCIERNGVSIYGVKTVVLPAHLKITAY